MPGSSDQSLNIVIKARDEASAVFAAVQRNTTALHGNLIRAADASRTFAVSMGAAAVAAGGLLGYGAKVAADLQTAEIGLTTLLGSAEEAGKTVERIKKEAARTPFELVGLTQATQLLSSVTHDGDKALDVVLDIGEGLAAMGKGQAELDRIIVNLQQIASVGHASMLDIKQFAFAGIPIFEMLQQQTGLAGEALGKFIEDGGVTFDLLTNMFDKANDAGGRFFSAYENQSGSFNQSLSNLKDSFGIFLATTVETTGVFDMLTRAMQTATEFLNAHKDSIADAIRWLGEHKMLLYIVAGAIMGAFVPAIYAAAVAFGTLAVSLAPFMLAGAVVAGLVAGIVWTVQNWDLVVQKVNEVMDTYGFLAPVLTPFMLSGTIISGLVKGIAFMVQHWDIVIEKVRIVTNTFQSLADMYNRVKDTVSKPINFVANLAGSAVSAAGGFMNPNATFNLPKFEMGGYVNAPRGKEVPAILHGGEYVLPAGNHSGGGGNTVIINNPVVRNDQDLIDMRAMIEDYFRSIALNHKFT